MFKIEYKNKLYEGVNVFKINAPRVAKSCQPGQFIILRLHEYGERIPLTIADFDRDQGTITILVQEAGKTTIEMGMMKQDDNILDVAGPFGKPSDIENFGNVVCVGGGFGIAAIHPIARALKEKGNNVVSIIGARKKELLIMLPEMQKASNEVLIATDDGSYGTKGFVSDILKKLITDNKSQRDPFGKIDYCLAIGPIPMMKVISDITKQHNIKTAVSLNPVMIDGTGMCGGCRITVDRKRKFACVDGPEFDASLVDFDSLVKRQKRYQKSEKESLEKFHEKCKIYGK
jgi:ferredoxin--NADP+ reductase